MINFDKYKKQIKTKKLWSKDDLYSLVNQIKEDLVTAEKDNGRVINMGKVYKPETLQKYDIITSFVCGTAHPCIVYRVDDKYVYAICMSTTEAPHNIHKFEQSRMFKCWLTNSVIRNTKEQALTKFVGLFDNITEADVAFEKVKLLYKDLFNFETHETNT